MTPHVLVDGPLKGQQVFELDKLDRVIVSDNFRRYVYVRWEDGQLHYDHFEPLEPPDAA